MKIPKHLLAHIILKGKQFVVIPQLLCGKCNGLLKIEVLHNPDEIELTHLEGIAGNDCSYLGEKVEEWNIEKDKEREKMDE